MDRTRDMLRSGAWLTRERIRLVAAALLVASAVGLLYLVVTANGLVDTRGRPLGTDFSNVYAAGSYVLEGDPEAPFDPVRQHAREQRIFGNATPFYGWHYPPFFLLVAAALGVMPYGLALMVWQVGTLSFYVVVIGAVLRSSLPAPRAANAESVSPELQKAPWIVRLRKWWSCRPDSVASETTPLWMLLALAYPAVLVNLGHGQNGFLTAALLGAALVQLERRPVIAGILFGLLAYKPQFALMIPLALVANGRWRTVAAAALTVAFLAAATTIAFGPQVWQAFFASTRFARMVALEQGNTGWFKIQSVFAWARMWGAPVTAAYALQGSVTATLGGATVWLWRSSAPYPLKAAALCLATILATPYTFDYDMMVVAPAIAFIAADGLARGFGAWEKTAIAAMWLTPLVARSVSQATLIPVGVPAMLALFALILRRASLDLMLPVAFSVATPTIIAGPGGGHGHDIAAFE
jgi:hypothetical protein